ncbi:MAG: hypothetical protein N4A40_00145 [Tissierellales bacterium]|jgi:hypothetical protein|nr:hypothetical protein [Tissierellales bacterium]
MSKKEDDIRYYLKPKDDTEKKSDSSNRVNAKQMDDIGPNNNYELLSVFFVERNGHRMEKAVAYMIRDIKKGRARIYTEETALIFIQHVSYAKAIKNARVKLENGELKIVSREDYPDIYSDFYAVVIDKPKLNKKLSTVATIVDLKYLTETKIQTKVISFEKYIGQYFLGS